MRLNHLETWNAHIRVLSPVYIGSGQSLTKREYIYLPHDMKVLLPNLQKLTAFLGERGLLPQYEQYLLQSGRSDLHTFLSGHRISQEAYHSFVQYELDAGEIVGDQASFRELFLFMKDASGRPYLPGSSIKGTIRTALAALGIAGLNQQAASQLRDQSRADLRQASYLRYCHASQKIETQLFRTLRANVKRLDDGVNDILRGLRVSDSDPIPFEALTICGKIDRHIDGREGQINLYRESVIPGTEIAFSFTIDRSYLDPIAFDKSIIVSALNSYDQIYSAYFGNHFPVGSRDAEQVAPRGAPLFIGGGAGYMTKTLSYPLWREQALPIVSSLMQRQFPKHGHDQDERMGVSPHTIKMVRYQGSAYQAGRCELVFDTE